MNFKKLFFMLTFVVLFATTAFAQQTWYVNNGPSGNDGRNGLSATIPVPDDFVTGPKKTINNAISYANANDVIVVAFTGVDYGTGTGEPATLSVTKKLTFQSTGGTVGIAGTTLFEVATGLLATNVTFNSGNFNLKGGLTLTSGTLTNSSGLVNVGGGTITVSAINTTTKVTGQLTFSGTVNWVYNAIYTTADEFPNTGGTINNFNSGAVAVTVKSGAAVTMTGVFTTGAALNLGGNTWTLTNAGGATVHTIGGNVTNGTLALNMTNNATFNGGFTLPTLTATNATVGAKTLDLAGPTAVTGSLSVGGTVIAQSTGNTITTLGTTGYTGNVLTLSGTGTVGLGNALVTIHGNVLLSSTGLNVTNAGQINFTNGAGLTINGNVTNSAGVVLSNAVVQDAGLISFPDQILTINGAVTLNGALSGSTTALTDYFNNGDIRFANTTTLITITGSVTNSATSTATLGAAVGVKVSDNYRVTFASTSGNVVTGGFANSTAIPAVGTGVTNANNGTILFTGRAAGTVGTLASRTGAVSNTSVSSIATNGLIDFRAAATGAFYGTSISQGAFGAGGDITFGNHLLDITGNITNARTVAGADITVPVGGATVTHTIGGYIHNSGLSTISIDLTGNDIVAATGRVESSSATGSVAFPNAGTGAISIGGLVVSAGTVNIPVTHDATLTINGTVNITGGTALLQANGGDAITVTGDASFTGGTITTTGRSGMTLNSVNITVGGATANPTFSGEPIIVGVPAPIQLVNFMVGAANPTIAGALTVNSSGLAKAVEFSGGSLKILGLLTFQAGKVHLAGAVNLIAQLAADPAFTNTAGYTTDDNARVTINATGGDPGVRGAGDFGNLEFNSQGQTTVIGNGGAGITAKGTIYLTAGPVNNSIGGQNINFDNSTVLPTIVRNAGAFNAVPTFTSNVNVTYIGGDKASGNELPIAPSTKLQNLTVATSIGNVAGKGVVTVGANTIVNGTINVYANQALLIDAVTLTMKGAAITLNGDIANEGAGLLEFGATTGTTVTGAGYLPNLQVAAGSAGNVIGGKAVINQLLGTDNVRSGDDFDPATTTAQGTLNFVAGTNDATFNLTGVAFDGSMIGNVTTNGTGNTLFLGGNFVSAGTLTHNAGTINVGAFNYEQRGAAVNLGTTANALWAGTGTFVFLQNDATTNSAFTLTSNAGGSTISINTQLNNKDVTAAQDDLILAGGPLTISGTFTITDGELVLGQNLTLTGSAFTIAAAGSESGAGVLRLNAATPPMTVSFAANTNISSLRISNDVNLTGAGANLTVTTLFTHDGGVLNFGTRNLTFQTAFTRTAGTYSGTTGYMVLDANGVWTVDQGDGFSIPNLRFTSSGAANLTLSNAAGRGTITVTGAMDFQMAANTLTTNGKLAVADMVTVNYQSGAISAAPAYAGGINLYIVSLGGVGIPANIWPTTANLVQTLRINSAAAGDAITLPGNRTIYGTNTLDLRVGTLTLGANTLTLVSGTTIRRRQGGSVTAGAGGLAFPADNNVNVIYEPTLATAGGDILTGIELPAEMNNLTITRAANVGNALITINSAATVNGTLTVYNNLTANSQLTAKGAVTIATDGTNTNAGAPVVTFAQASPLVFGGASGQSLDVTGGQNIAWMRLNLTGTNPVLNVTGNLTIPVGGGLLFTNGILNMGTYTLTLPRPSTAGVTFNGLSYDRSAVTGTNVGHVVGKIGRAANAGDGGAGTNGRFEFPVGTLTGQYRPASITFTPSYVVGNPVTILVSHVNTSPMGTVNLPLNGGNGVMIGNYPAFHWLVSTTPTSLTSTQGFDVDLQANNIGYPYASDTQLRIIRRQDGSAESNGWLMQGTAANYANYQVVNGTDTLLVARTVSSQGGLISQGSLFTIGVPTRAPIFTAPAVTTIAIDENATQTVTVVADPRDVGETVTYSKVSGPAWATLAGNVVTLAPTYADGSTTPYAVVIRATDSGGSSTDMTLTVTVNNVNRAPSFTATGAAVQATASVNSGATHTFTYLAVDADGDAMTYTVAVDTAPTGTYSIAAALGTFTFAPVFADAGKVFTFTVTATDAGTLTATTTTAVTVGYPVAVGDVTGNGTIAADDASEILKYVVGLVTFTPQQMYAADVNSDSQVGALDAAWILYYVVNGTWPTAKMSAAMGSVEIGQLQKEAEGYLLPINLAQTTGVLSVYAELDVDANVEVLGVTGRLPQGWISSSKIENGKVMFAFAGLEPLKEGSIAYISLRLKDKEANATIFGNANLNDGYSAALNSVTVREIPSEFALSQNYPNPFNPTTSIKFAIPENANVQLNVYNMLGQKVRTIMDGMQDAGYYTVNWDGTNDLGSKVSSGIYIYRISAGKYNATMKMNLLK
jgi:fibronectin-binding autotransporter adhesin